MPATRLQRVIVGAATATSTSTAAAAASRGSTRTRNRTHSAWRCHYDRYASLSHERLAQVLVLLSTEKDAQENKSF